ncbi:hypothetical protein B296_00021245 [Ensete ventricosum]|uniref:Uncharacterized protein n=1 Tax=Ensete ventricosum TaxID=4639 RepID=A0A427A859_ENSVE|nr:hypothetical protein B296_00021245 [Ensete ventricosum]
MPLAPITFVAHSQCLLSNRDPRCSLTVEWSIVSLEPIFDSPAAPLLPLSSPVGCLIAASSSSPAAASCGFFLHQQPHIFVAAHFLLLNRSR